MIILTKNILKKKKHKFNKKYDDDDSCSIHNLMKPNTPTPIQPPKLMKKSIPREFIDIANNTDTIATETRETQETLYNDANQQLNMTFEAFKVKENQDNMLKMMLQNFWRNTYKRNEPTRTQATQTLKNQRDAMASAFTTMLDNNKPPEQPPKTSKSAGLQLSKYYLFIIHVQFIPDIFFNFCKRRIFMDAWRKYKYSCK